MIEIFTIFYSIKNSILCNIHTSNRTIKYLHDRIIWVRGEVRAHFLLMCLHQPRKVTDHVYVCCVYQFCLVLRFDHLYWNSSYNVVSLFVILLINLILTLWMLLYSDATDCKGVESIEAIASVSKTIMDKHNTLRYL